MALGSLIASVVAIALGIFLVLPKDSSHRGTDETIATVIWGLLIAASLLCAIIAFCGSRKADWRKILFLTPPGLLINGVILAIFAVHFAQGFSEGIKRRAQDRKIMSDLQASVQYLKQDVRDSFDPEMGITNSDTEAMDRVARQLKEASRKLSGDEAHIMEATAKHLGRMRQAMTAYESVTTAMLETNVLGAGTLKEKSQIKERQNLVREFLLRNAELKKTVAESESYIRRDLTLAGVSSAKIEAAMKGFKSEADLRNALILKIRDCDQRIGDATLGVLELLDTHWGKWRYNSDEDTLLFDKTEATDTYNRLVEEVSAAGEEQVKLQGKLVNIR